MAIFPQVGHRGSSPVSDAAKWNAIQPHISYRPLKLAAAIFGILVLFVVCGFAYFLS